MRAQPCVCSMSQVCRELHSHSRHKAMMTSALHTVRHVSWRTRTSFCSLLEAVTITPCRRANATTSASKHECGVTCRSATYHFNPSSASGAAISKVFPLGGIVPKQQRPYCCSLPRNRSVMCGHSPGQSLAALVHSFNDAAAGMTRSGRIGQRCSTASVGSVQSFGGQSVVPWELALFLVEEVGVGGRLNRKILQHRDVTRIAVQLFTRYSHLRFDKIGASFLATTRWYMLEHQRRTIHGLFHANCSRMQSTNRLHKYLLLRSTGGGPLRTTM